MDGASEAVARRIASGDFEAAEDLLRGAIADRPNDLDLRQLQAACLAKQLCFDRALEQSLHVLHRAEARWAQRLGAIRTMVACATQMGMPDIVRPYLAGLSEGETGHPSERCWHPRILARLGAAEEAHEILRDLLKEFPGDPLITGILGQTLLELGNGEGRRHELAQASRAFFDVYYPRSPPRDRMWEGEALEGRSVAILCHSGFGDLFQYLRYVRGLKALGAGHVAAIANPRCHGLVASSGVDEVAAPDDQDAILARSDLWVPVFGLARVAASAGDGVEAGGYLAAPESDAAGRLAQEMRARAAGRPCLGLYWHSDRDLGEHKSIPLAAILPLLARPDIHCLILQRGFALRKMTEAGLGGRATVMGEDLSFDETASLMNRLDGVVSICAWPFHLAGALGVRTWLLAGRVLDGRHLNRERMSVLYSDCASLVRQGRAGDWPRTIARLMTELDTLTRP
jgi:hypothetical protein